MDADLLRARGEGHVGIVASLHTTRHAESSSLLRQRIRVLISHAVPLVSAGIGAVLGRSGEFELVAAGAGADQQLLAGSRRIADVVIADFASGLSTLSAAGGCRNVLILADDDGETLVRSALGRGARGFLLHTCSVDELAAAVRTISRGATALSPSVAGRIAQSFSYEQLTERETEVLRLMMQGLSDKDMARELAIALGTVKSHMKAILTKLGAARRTEAAAIARRRGLAGLESAIRLNQTLSPSPSKIRRPRQEPQVEPAQDHATRRSRVLER